MRLGISFAVVTLLTGAAACSRGEQVATTPTLATEVSTTAPGAPTTQTPSTTAPATTMPITATTAVATTAAPTSAAPASSTVPATSAAPTSAAPSTAPPAPTDRAVLVQYGHAPIAVFDGAWQLPQWDPSGLPAVAPQIAEVVLTGLGVAEPITGATYGPTEYYCAGDEQGYTLVYPPGVEVPDSDFISVTADWDVQPRPVAQTGLDNPEYQTVGESLVDPAAGVDPATGEVTQIVRADLDGNGADEVLFRFAHQTDDGGFGAAGDFTLIIARFPQPDATVVDSVLWSFYEQDPVDFPNPGDADLVAVADLNGDGVMEVVVGSRYWEAVLADVYVFDGTALTALSGGGCGV